MLDEETDAEIGNLIRSTVMRLLYASCPTHPSHWISICRKLLLATSSRDSIINCSTDQDLTNTSEGDTQLGLGEDDENMVSSSKSMPNQGYSWDASSVKTKRNKHLRYKTRVFAAECLSHLTTAVGKHPAHFDLSLARKQKKGPSSGDWLVLQLQELVSLAYQISTIQFEDMQPIGVGLLSTIVDKFEEAPDPELPGCLLLEQYQAQLVSALRAALSMSSGPVLLEAGLQLATKILISGVIRGDRAAIKRIFSLISRPLNDFEDLYYPSFAEWVSCKIKVRLLAAHASLKCYTYILLRGDHAEVPDEYLALLPLFSKSSHILGKRWIGVLQDYCYLCLSLHSKKNRKSFLEGIKSPLVSSKLKSCLEETWPVILQAVALDAVPVDGNVNVNKSSDQTEEKVFKDFLSGYSMVELGFEECQFLWGFALLILFQGQNVIVEQQIIPLSSAKSKHGGDSWIEEAKPLSLRLCEVVLPVFQSLCAERFFSTGFLTVDICKELLQVLTHFGARGDSWNCLAVTVLSQIVHNCPDDFLKIDSFASLVMELCLAYLYKTFARNNSVPGESNGEDLIRQLLTTAKTLLNRFRNEERLKSILAFMLTGYKCARGASTEASFSKIIEFILQICDLLNNFVEEKSIHGFDAIHHLQIIIGACQNVTSDFTRDCIEMMHLLENRKSNLRRLVYAKLAFCLEQMLSFADLVYKMELCPEKKSSMNVATFIGCTRSIQLVLKDANIQVQVIGLQVLKSMIQKSSNSKGSSSLLLLTGELFREILMVIQNIIMKPVTKESAALAGECLRTLLLMQTLPKEEECQKGLMTLLLEAVVMILSGTENSLSEETRDLRSTVVRLVSHVAQVPSAGVHLKEVLLGMPGTHRQQVQDIIRASVTQEHQTTGVKSHAGTLEIKLPRQSEGRKEQKSPASPPPQTDEDYEEEDDWDAFQSFTTATSAINVTSTSYAENSSFPETNSEDDDFQEFSSSIPSNDLKKPISEQHQNREKEEVAPESPEKNDVHESESCDLTSEACESCESRDCSSVSRDAPVQNDDLAPSNQHPDSSAKEADEVDDAMGISMNKENQSDSLNHQVPVDSSSVGNFSSSSVVLQVPANSADLKASNLEVDDKSHGDLSLESAGDSKLQESAENDDIVAPENVDSCSQLSGSQEKNLNTHEDAERKSSMENWDTVLNQETTESPALPGGQDTTINPTSPEIRGELKERLTGEYEITAQNQEVTSMPGSSEAQVAGGSLPEDQDTMLKSKPLIVDEDSVERTSIQYMITNQHQQISQLSELPEPQAANVNLEQPEDSVEKTTSENETKS